LQFDDKFKEPIGTVLLYHHSVIDYRLWRWVEQCARQSRIYQWPWTYTCTTHAS